MCSACPGWPSRKPCPNEQPASYKTLLQRDFTDDLELAARLAKRLFLGSFLYANVPARMIQFMRKSPTFCEIMQDLFAGTARRFYRIVN